MNKINKWIAAIVAIIVIVIIGYSVSGNSNEVSSVKPIKIGVATILSGDIAAFGENLVNVANMAVNEINSSGGINGRKVELVVEDAGCDSKTGLSAVQKLINVDKVKYIIAGMCSNGTLAAAPLANKKEVVMITPSTGGKNIDKSGKYIFRVGNSDLLVGRDIADSMFKLGYDNVGVIAESTEYSVDIKNSFKKRVGELGMHLAFSEEFKPGTTDFRTMATKIKSADLDAILIASQTGISGGNLIKQMRNLGLNTSIFSDFLLVTNANVKKIIGSFDGIYFADPAYDSDNPKVTAFFKKYKENYGNPPMAAYFSAGTYDSLQMIFSAIKNVGDNSVKVRQWLLNNIRDWNGFMGKISLDANGNANTGFTIKEIKNGKAVELK